MEHILDHGHISFRKRCTKPVDSCRIRMSCLFKPVLHQVDEQFSYLPVGKCQPHLFSGQALLQGQIACGIQYAPDISNGFVYIPVGQFLSNAFHNGPAIYQLFNLIPRGLVCFLKQAADKVVSTCVRPVVFRLSFLVPQQYLRILNDIPRTVDGFISKPIAIIPVAHRSMELLQSITAEKFFYFTVCKSKAVTKIGIRYRHHIQVIQPCKYTLFGNPQTSRKDGKIKIVICLQRIAEHIANERNHLIIIARLKRFV